MTNALYEDDCTKMLLFSDHSWVQLALERMLELCVAGHTVGVSAPVAKLMSEDEEEKDRGKVLEEDRSKGSSSTDDLALG